MINSKRWKAAFDGTMELSDVVQQVLSKNKPKAT